MIQKVQIAQYFQGQDTERIARCFEKSVQNAAFGPVGDFQKRVYKKPEVVDICKFTDSDPLRQNGEIRSRRWLGAARLVIERVRDRLCPRGCELVFDRTMIGGSYGILVLFSFDLGGWSFKTEEWWSFPNEGLSESEKESEFTSILGDIDSDMHLIFEGAARELMLSLAKGRQR